MKISEGLLSNNKHRQTEMDIAPGGGEKYAHKGGVI